MLQLEENPRSRVIWGQGEYLWERKDQMNMSLYLKMITQLNLQTKKEAWTRKERKLSMLKNHR